MVATSMQASSQGGSPVRMGLGGRKTPPHRAAGIVLIVVGVIILLMSMPLFVYASVIGGLIAFVGYTLIGR